MKNVILILFLFFGLSSYSQKIIEGKVVSEKNEPLMGASVYFNNTSIGTITDTKGGFKLKIPEGNYNLIISFLGFNTINYKIKTTTYSRPILFKMTERTNILNEVVITKTIYDDNWWHNLAIFKSEFIGLTKLAKECKIINPKVLHFEFDKQKNSLKAYAKEPLKIKHNGLGYLITYDLENFIRSKTYTTYLGYSRYKNLKGGSRKQKKWKANRLKTFRGSPVHFFKSVINNTFTEEGFIVNQFKRIPNSNRPSKQEIQKAKKLIGLHRITISFSSKITQPKNALDSAMVILKKSRLPFYRDYLYKTNLTQKEIINQIDSTFYLSFKNNLSIIYHKENEEKGYLLRLPIGKRRKPLKNQMSSIIKLKENSVLDKRGVLINPLDIFYEGYWSYEKYANTLPLNYVPPKN